METGPLSLFSCSCHHRSRHHAVVFCSFSHLLVLQPLAAFAGPPLSPLHCAYSSSLLPYTGHDQPSSVETKKNNANTAFLFLNYRLLLPFLPSGRGLECPVPISSVELSVPLVLIYDRSSLCHRRMWCVLARWVIPLVKFHFLAFVQNTAFVF